MIALPENAPPVIAIVRIVADAYGFRADDLLGNRRFKDMALARQVAMYVAVEVVGHSLLHTQRWIGHHNSTIWHAKRLIAAEIATDPALGQKVREIVYRVRRWREEIVALSAPATRPSIRVTSWPDQARHLQGIGWSVNGIARYLDQPPADVASVCGVCWRSHDRGARA